MKRIIAAVFLAALGVLTACVAIRPDNACPEVVRYAKWIATLRSDDVVAKFKCSAMAHIRNLTTDKVRAIDSFGGTEGQIIDVPFDLLERDVEADFISGAAGRRRGFETMKAIKETYKGYAEVLFNRNPSRTTRITWTDALNPDEVLELWNIVCEEDEFINPPSDLQCKTAELDPPTGADGVDAGGVGPSPTGGGTGPTPCDLTPELCDTP